MIDHNSFFGGSVQSLGSIDERGQRFTIGVVEVGDYNFATENTEEIRVLTGRLHINGQWVVPGGDVFVIPKGGAVKIAAPCTTVYLCIYR